MKLGRARFPLILVILSSISASISASLSACMGPAGEGPQRRDGTVAAVVPAATEKAAAEPPAVGLDAIAFAPEFAGAPASTTTRQGVRIDEFAPGEGEPGVEGSVLLVHYTGYLLDGTVFDESIARGKPYKVRLGKGGVIEGWQIGLAGAKQGTRRRLVIPPELAYGERKKGKIPPGSTLVFTTEVLSLTPPPPPPKGSEAFAGEPAKIDREAGGLEIHTFADGEGPEAAEGDRVEVHYLLRLTDGKEVDSSRSRGPMSVELGAGGTIRGFDRGLHGIRKGGLRKLVIPPELGYGDKPAGEIPPGSKLIFEIEAVTVTPKG